MYSVSKEFAFSASHRLDHLPKDHPCHRLHGHNYVVIVELATSELDHQGFVLEYSALDPLKAGIDEHLDHRHLNDFMDDLPPTAENLAECIYGAWIEGILQQHFPRQTVVVAVHVKETPKTRATFETLWEGCKDE